MSRFLFSRWAKDYLPNRPESEVKHRETWEPPTELEQHLIIQYRLLEAQLDALEAQLEARGWQKHMSGHAKPRAMFRRRQPEDLSYSEMVEQVLVRDT